MFANSDDYSVSEDAVYMSLDKTMLDRLRQGGVVDSLVFRQRGKPGGKCFLRILAGGVSGIGALQVTLQGDENRIDSREPDVIRFSAAGTGMCCRSG